MKYLVVCDHEKFTVHATDPYDAKLQCRCIKCKYLNGNKTEWLFKGVRVYREDRDIVVKQLPNVRRKVDPVEQLDWIGK